MRMQSWTRAIFGVLALAAGLASVQASALFDAELLYGRRWYDIKPKSGSSSGVQGSEINIAAHLDPIPLVPIAFGASVAMVDFNKDDFGVTVKEAKLVEPALELMAWIPMVPVVTPYAKVKLPLLATYTQKSEQSVTGGTSADEVSAVYKVSGYHLNAGIKYAPLPLFKILLETGLGMEKAEADEIKVNGATLSSSGSDFDLNSKFLAVGFEVGL